MTIIIEPFQPLGTAVLDVLNAEAQNISRFLSMDVELTVKHPQDS